MPIDIIEETRQYLGKGYVPKIDPNTQEPFEQEKFNSDIESAAIPVVLAGYYKNTRNEKDAADTINRDGNGILMYLFGEQITQITKATGEYSKSGFDTAENVLQKTAVAVKSVLQQHIKELNGAQVMKFFTDQRSNILKHLPVELHIGELINDPAMDDKTNKMEGPLSGLMHGIEKIFSSTK